jgi:spoIIIJ-associated protein
VEKKYTLAKYGPRIEELLRQVLQAGGFRVQFQATDTDIPHPDFENPEIRVKFSGPDVDLLLENRAELLLALEHVTMEMLRIPPEDHSRLCFDADDYRALRVEELREAAKTAAERVRRSGMPFKFSPMNSRERRIIHLALRDEQAVYSESEGMGPMRQVVIRPGQAPKNAVPVGSRQHRRGV